MSMDLSRVACTPATICRLASPQLVAANHILSLSSAELQALIAREAAENPHLAMEETPICQRCGRPLQRQVCPACGPATPPRRRDIAPAGRAFGAGGTARAALRDLIDRETTPLTDRELAEALRAQGLVVARRTVARYREQLGILPSSLRGSWDPRPAAHARDCPNPERLAQALLHDVLDEREREQLATRGYLDVFSPSHPGRRYRIPGHGGRVQLYEDGSAVCELCVVPVEPLPRDDVVVLHKLLIEGDEEAYLRSANRLPVRFPMRLP
jgi:hypothetical protein